MHEGLKLVSSKLRPASRAPQTDAATGSPRSDRIASLAATSAASASPSAALVTSSSEGNVGATRMLRSFGIVPVGKGRTCRHDGDAGLLRQVDHPSRASIEHIEADEVSPVGPVQVAAPVPPSSLVKTSCTS